MENSEENKHVAYWGVKFKVEVSPVFSVQDQIRDRDVYPQIQLWVNGRKCLPWGAYHLRKFWLKNKMVRAIPCDFRAWNFSTLFNLFS